jgi:hypothetical protein
VTICAGAIVLTALVVSIASLALAASTFPDVPATHPYYTAITDLASRGIIGGYANGNFGPGDDVKRQQFAKMIVLTGGYPVSESDVCHFVDVAKSDATTFYPDNFVAVCAARGITTGKTATTFDPYGNITRYQVVTMVVRAADDLQPGLLAAPPTGWNGNSTWAADPTHGANAARAEYNGLLAGLDLSTLSPSGNMTRGEVAQVLHNLLAKLTPPTTTTTSASTTTSSSSTTTTTQAGTTTTSSSTTTTSSTTSTTVTHPVTMTLPAGIDPVNTSHQVTVRVVDQFGNPFPGVKVYFYGQATEGSGVPTAAQSYAGNPVTTDASGVASAAAPCPVWSNWNIWAQVNSNGSPGGSASIPQVPPVAGVAFSNVVTEYWADTVLMTLGSGGIQLTIPSSAGYPELALLSGRTFNVYRDSALIGALVGTGVYGSASGSTINLNQAIGSGINLYVNFVGDSLVNNAPNWIWRLTP